MTAGPVPSEESWGNWRGDLDQSSAHRLFAGKTLEEVSLFFKTEGALGVFDELLFMPPAPFQYYVLAYRDYVMSDDMAESEAPDVASAFLNLVLAKLRTEPDTMRPVISELFPAVEHVAENQDLFGASIEIYGSFPAKLAEIRAMRPDA